MVGRAASVVSPFYSILLDLPPPVPAPSINWDENKID